MDLTKHSAHTLANTTYCSFCSSEDNCYLYPIKTAGGENYAFHRCQDCAGVFLTPKPSATTLAEAYSSLYYGNSTRKFVGPVERVIDWFRSRRSSRVAHKLRANAKVLDLGCGNGGFLAGLVKHGIDAHGIELPGGSADRAMTVPSITVHIGTLEESNYINQQFDAITLWHVFEHLDDPRKTLEFLKKMLKPGGRLYLSLPNPESYQARIFKGDWLHHDPPRHLFYFGPQAMQREVEALGLYLESKSFWSMEQNPFGIVQSILNRFNSERDVLYESLKGNSDIAKRYSRTHLFTHKALGMLIAPFAILAAALESALGRGGTMELTFIRPIDKMT